jgi:hypothetical protein
VAVSPCGRAEGKSLLKACACGGSTGQASRRRRPWLGSETMASPRPLFALRFLAGEWDSYDVGSVKWAGLFTNPAAVKEDQPGQHVRHCPGIQVEDSRVLPACLATSTIVQRVEREYKHRARKACVPCWPTVNTPGTQGSSSRQRGRLWVLVRVCMPMTVGHSSKTGIAWQVFTHYAYVWLGQGRT